MGTAAWKLVHHFSDKIILINNPPLTSLMVYTSKNSRNEHPWNCAKIAWFLFWCKVRNRITLQLKCLGILGTIWSERLLYNI